MATRGPGLATLPALRWSISIDELLRFTSHCMNTTQWEALVQTRGDEEAVTLDDLLVHFVVP